jgi:hypothetical protein
MTDREAKPRDRLEEILVQLYRSRPTQELSESWMADVMKSIPARCFPSWAPLPASCLWQAVAAAGLIISLLVGTALTWRMKQRESVQSFLLAEEFDEAHFIIGAP